ncbi:MAG: hypothetical protein M1816_003168 [Peltula sp. TS41687]|nr:MAG: hypothetical protein M1816_003168 [Peltula sp. TS41687]
MWSITRNSIISFAVLVLFLDLSLFTTFSNATPFDRYQDGYNPRRGVRPYRPPTTTRRQPTPPSSSPSRSSSVTQDAVSPTTTSGTTAATSSTNAALASATLPSNGGGLPAPASGLILKAVVIGRGTQNYTCSGGNSTTAPVAKGARADLFDASSRLSAQDDLNSLTSDSLRTQPDLPLVGVHYFNGAGVPTFDLLDSRGLLFMGGKLNNVPAPSGANRGFDNEGAVDWLRLGDNGQSFGVKDVYRVETAGGKAPVDCTGQDGELTVRYSTQYWFYG